MTERCGRHAIHRGIKPDDRAIWVEDAHAVRRRDADALTQSRDFDEVKPLPHAIAKRKPPGAERAKA